MVTVACSVHSVNADPPVDPLYSGELTVAKPNQPPALAAESSPVPAQPNITELSPPALSPAPPAASLVAAPQPSAASQSDEVSAPEVVEPVPVAVDPAPVDSVYQACEQRYLAALNGTPLRYHATYKSIGVDSTRVLKHLGQQRWQLSSAAELLFMGIDETSEFQLPGWQLLGFNHQRKGMSDRHNLVVRVDQEKGEFSADARGKTQVYPYQGMLFDELNHQLKLQLDVACRPQQQQFEYLVAKRKGPRTYTYHKRGQETVDTNAGKFDAIRLERANEGRLISIWLAPELAYAVVKLVYEDDGEASSLSIKTKPKLPVILAQ